MKKIVTLVLLVFLVFSVFAGIFTPVSGEEEVDSSPIGNPRWSTYKAYYNESFTISKDWDPDNVAIAVSVQTDDQTSGTFTSAEVMQSTIDFLDGNKTQTGTSRNVLVELFTATWCPNCPAAVGACDRLTRDSNYFPAKATIVELHGSGTHGNADGAARQSWYSITGIPTTVFDGINSIVGGNSNPNSTNLDTSYSAAINTRAQTASIIDIATFGSKDNSTGWINASVELLNPTPLRNLKVRFFLVEDIYPLNNSGAFYRYTVQKILTAKDFTPPNHPPTIKTALPDVEIDEDDSDSSSIKLEGAFEDEDLDVLTYSSNRDDTDKQNILVEYDEGNVTLTPDPNWNGVEEITFYANDSKVVVEQKVTVTVVSINDPPIVANAMPDFTMFEDAKVENKFNLSYIFSDIDTDPVLNAVPQAPLEYSYTGNDHITVTLSNDNWVSFEPETDWNGEETITFAAEDPDSEVAYENVKIKVRSDNDPPVLNKAMPDAVLDEDSELEDHIDLNEYFNDKDEDSLTYGIIEPDNIDIKLNYEGSKVYLSIYPDEDYYGTGTATVEATDIPDSTPVVGTFEITVNSVNDQPILNETDEWDIVSSSIQIEDDVITVQEDSVVNFYLTAYDTADNDELTFSDDTELFDIDPTTGQIFFTPENSDVGQYDVEFTVDDGAGTDNTDSAKYTFIVQNVNDPPENVKILSPEDGKTYITGTEIQFTASAEDVDLEIEANKEQLTYEWFADELPETLSYDKEFKTSLEPGDYTIKLKVADKAGQKTIVQVSITVDIDKTIDTDKDGTPDHEDLDDDGDGIPDDWEEKYPNILDPLDSTDAARDSDADGYTNLQEYLGKDGVAGGNDATNPTSKASKPETKPEDVGSDGGDDESSEDNSMFFYTILGIVIAVVILLIIFAVMRKPKRLEDEQESLPQVSQPQPQPQTITQPGVGPGTGTEQDQYQDQYQNMDQSQMPPSQIEKMPTPAPVPVDTQFQPYTQQQQMQAQEQNQYPPQYGQDQQYSQPETQQQTQEQIQPEVQPQPQTQPQATQTEEEVQQ